MDDDGRQEPFTEEEEDQLKMMTEQFNKVFNIKDRFSATEYSRFLRVTRIENHRIDRSNSLFDVLTSHYKFLIEILSGKKEMPAELSSVLFWWSNNTITV